MIYLDSAATSLLKPSCVYEAVVDAMQLCGGSGRGAHPAALEAARAIHRARSVTAALFGCDDPSRVAFSHNATASLNAAIFGLLDAGAHAITTVSEHNSVLRPLHHLRSQGMGLSYVPVDGSGVLDYDAFTQALRPNTRAVVCAHASNLTGNVHDVAFISRFCREHGLLLILDAAQTAGSADLSVAAMGVDALCFTGHKGLLGPQGTGGLVLREGLAIRPTLRGGTGVHSFAPDQPGEMPEVLEAGTQNAHGLAGLAAGIDYLNETGLSVIRGREAALARRFYEGVANLPGVRVYGDMAAKERAPIVSLNVSEADSSAVSDTLSHEYGICTRPGIHCAPLLHQALGTAQQGMVRFSFSHRNTVDEVDAAIAALMEFAE